MDGPRLFPFAHTCALKFWTRVAKKAGLDEVCRCSGSFPSRPSRAWERRWQGRSWPVMWVPLSDDYRRVPQNTLSAAHREVERNLCLMIPR